MPTVGKPVFLIAARESFRPGCMKSMPSLLAMVTTSTPAALSALNAVAGARKWNSFAGAGTPLVVIAVSRLTMAKLADFRVLAIGAMAVAGLGTSNEGSDPSKWVSAAKAIVIACSG